jgi:RHS repeat-associated protein
VNGTPTNYALDLNAGLTQVLSDGSNTYLYGAMRVGELQAGGMAYHLGDALGSVRQLVDASGNVTLARNFEPYGSTLGSAGSGSSVWQFTGEARDTSTGLTFLRARYLSSQTGRFVSRDTWAGDYNRPLSLNRWAYANANPILYTDPSGKGVCFYGTDPVTGACRPAPWASALPPGLAHVAQPSISPQQTIGVMILAAVCYVGYRVFKDAMPRAQTHIQTSPIERLYTLPQSEPERQPTTTPFSPIPVSTKERERKVVIRFVQKEDHDVISGTQFLPVVGYQSYATTPGYLLAKETEQPGFLTDEEALASDLLFAGAALNEDKYGLTRVEYFVAFYRRGLDEMPYVYVFYDSPREIIWRFQRVPNFQDPDQVNISSFFIDSGRTKEKMSVPYLTRLLSLEHQ